MNLSGWYERFEVNKIKVMKSSDQDQTNKKKKVRV